ncbi:MAG: class I SAM-dependent methyltransferase [Gammaproteobacteria bacterium]
MLIRDHLPAPPPEAQAHSRRLLDHIRADIEAHGGWIGFARYMDLALYAPGLGYYSAGSTKLGAAGDFVTAPEISPLFARCVAIQSVEVFEDVDGGDVLELGAGTGALAAELLGALAEMGHPPDRYLILEISADLRERQRHTIEDRAGELAGCVQWIDTLPRPGIRGVILANEIVDSLPVERFRIQPAGVSDLGVGLETGTLRAVPKRADEPLRERVEMLREDSGAAWPSGFTSEVRLGLEAWLASVYDSLEQGAALFIDYGLPQRDYYSLERGTGTLRCHYRHRAHDDPFILVGLQDITAWVDFSALAGAGIDAGFAIAGFTTQAQFLIGCDLEGQLIALSGRGRGTQIELAQQVKRLTLPEEMGERFKVLGFGRDIERPLRGFAMRDLRGTL